MFSNFMLSQMATSELEEVLAVALAGHNDAIIPTGKTKAPASTELRQLCHALNDRYNKEAERKQPPVQG